MLNPRISRSSRFTAIDTRNLKIHEDATLPNITLSRHVVPEVHHQFREFLPWSGSVQVHSESRFGNPDDETDLSCIYAGLREAVPSIDIIPTATFREQI